MPADWSLQWRSQHGCVRLAAVFDFQILVSTLSILVEYNRNKVRIKNMMMIRMLTIGDTLVLLTLLLELKC